MSNKKKEVFLSRRYQANLCFMFLLLIFLIPEISISQGTDEKYPLSFELLVSNSADKYRSNSMVLLSKEEINKNYPDFNADAFMVMVNNKEIPSQYNRKDPGCEGIVFVLEEMEPRQALNLKVHYNKEGKVTHNYKKKTQAEISHKINGEFENKKYLGGEFKNTDALSVPEEHTDHSNFIRYEGPGWESDKVGYRYYLDWRNAVDVFGKKTTEMVLQNVGQDGFSSYHEMASWGMDVMKVGESLGIGSIAYFEDGKARRIDEVDSITALVSENGPVFSSITTNYYGWKVADNLHLKSHLSIHAGSRLTHQKIYFMGSGANLCTGIGKDGKAKVHSRKGDRDSWGYLATYGPQSLNSDKLGLAVFFPPQDFIEFTEDAKSHIVRLKERNNAVEYYFLAAWELEPKGLKDEASFLDYIEKTAWELAHPVKINFVHNE